MHRPCTVVVVVGEQESIGTATPDHASNRRVWSHDREPQPGRGGRHPLFANLASVDCKRSLKLTTEAEEIRRIRHLSDRTHITRPLTKRWQSWQAQDVNSISLGSEGSTLQRIWEPYFDHVNWKGLNQVQGISVGAGHSVRCC